MSEGPVSRPLRILDARSGRKVDSMRATTNLVESLTEPPGAGAASKAHKRLVSPASVRRVMPTAASPAFGTTGSAEEPSVAERLGRQRPIGVFAVPADVTAKAGPPAAGDERRISNGETLELGGSKRTGDRTLHTEDAQASEVEARSSEQHGCAQVEAEEVVVVRRDLAYEALATATSTDMSEGRGQLNAALKSIKEQTKGLDGPALAHEIEQRAKLYRRLMPDVILTAPALAKHWRRVWEESSRQPSATNRSSHTDCELCGGDRFVLVQMRGEFEEYAACPDCSTADTSFRRYDGTRARALDPARVRELISRA